MYNHMESDIKSDLLAYIMGLWHMEKMRKQVKNYNGAIKLKNKES